MIRRTCVISVFVFVASALLAAPALAYVPIVASTVPDHAKLALGADPAVVVWVDGTSLLAQRYSNATGAGTVRTVATGVTAISDWYATGHGTQVTVVWKDGATVWATCIDVASGSTVFAAVQVCTDAAVDGLDGGATSARLSGAAPDGGGGAYVWLTASGRGVTGYGDSLLNHISATGSLAAASPGLPVAKGTIFGLSADDEGHAFAVLQSPGRSSLATQRFSATLQPDPGWSNPIPPYSPLVPTPTASKTPLAVAAGSGATVAWREGTKVKVQRYPAVGGVVWISPPAVTVAGDVVLANDGLGGAYVAGPSGTSVLVGHALASGAVTTRTLGALALVQPSVGALVTNRAGDLFIGYGDRATSGAAGIGLLTWAGESSTMDLLTLRPDLFTSGVADGAGGAYLLGDGSPTGLLWRVGAGGGGYATLRPKALAVLWGKRVAIEGYVTQDALPVAGAAVTLATATSAAGSPPAPVQTQTDGYYKTTLAPKASATWTATAGAATSAGVRIEVQPVVTMTLSHTPSARLSETFTGSVSPNHKGQKVLVQKQVTKTTWKTVATGRLDSRSRYRITWYLPFRSATYKLRTIIPAHADHAQGTSRTGTFKVVITKG